jgi:ribose/xylose/arabinose/galactoside ABC-type transport system permease subunit
MEMNMGNNNIFNKAGILAKRFSMLLILAVMVLIFTIIKPQYFSAVNFVSVLIQASMLGVIATGMTLVMMTGGADMSVGMVAGLVALTALYPAVNGQLPFGASLLLGLALGVGIGAINGICVARLGIAPFVVTLGTMFLAQGMQYLFSGGGMAVSYGFPRAYLFIGRGDLLGIPMPIVIFAVIFFFFLFLTEFSPLGRYIKSIGNNQFASDRSGVRIRFYTFLVYVLSGLLASFLGLILGSFQRYISPDHGSSFLMDSLLVTLLGKTLLDGKTSVYGTAFGALFLRAFETGLAMIGLPVTVLNISKGTLLVLVLILNLLKQRNPKGRA